MAIPIALVAGMMAPLIKGVFDFFGGDAKKVEGVLEGGVRAVGGVIEEVLSRDEKVAARVNQALENHREFVLDFFGAAKDMPRIVQIVRGLTPSIVLFIALGSFVYFVVKGIIDAATVKELLMNNIELLIGAALGGGAVWGVQRVKNGGR